MAFRHMHGGKYVLTSCILYCGCIKGYPGTVEVSVTYIMTKQGVLKMIIEATTDKATPVNLAQHAYFNLAGHDSGDVLKHDLHLRG